MLSEVAGREEYVDLGVRVVTLMLTTTCNFRCAYCDQRRGPSRTMSPETLDAAIRQLVSSHFRRPRLVFFGGEPLLAMPLVRRALDRVRDWAPAWMKPDVRVVTNGSRLDEEAVGLLVDRGVFITISFDGIGRAQNDRAAGSFELLDGILVRLRRTHPRRFTRKLAVKATLTSRNVPFLAESVSYFLSRKIREIELSPVLPDDAGWGAREARVLDRQLSEVVELSLEAFRRSGEVPFRPFRCTAEPARSDAHGTCACGRRDLLFVDVDGTLAPCSGLAPFTLGTGPRAMHRVRSALGGLHVTDPDLPASLIRREERARRLRFLAGPESRQSPRGACARCKVRSSCFVCPIAVACNGGTVPAIQCDVNRLLSRNRAVFHQSTAVV